jgi:D-arabinose 1-dehydrogenase-like Zn-dependent alcohol dehydrogenase
MLAARLHEYSDDMEDVLSVDEVARPEATDANDVIIEVKGAGWCMTDNHVAMGTWDPFVTFPITLGHETSGEVVDVGEDVTMVDVGDQVLCYPAISCGKCRACRSGDDMYCDEFEFPGITTDGGFAEYMRTAERAVVPLPETVDPVTVAPHADAGLAAYHAVKKAVRELDPGDAAVLIGIGGLGHIGLQILNEMSVAEVIAVDVRDEALELADELGADHTINSGQADVVETVHSLTGDVQQVVDFVGADETTGYAAEMLSSGGDCHLVGYDGHVHEPTLGLVGDEISFEGTLAGTYPELQELVTLAEQGVVDMRVSTYELDEINTVAAKLERGEISGRAVITP